MTNKDFPTQNMGPSASDIKLQSVLNRGWLYRGEGNANVVLSLPKTHQTLRITKTDKPTTILGWFCDWLLQILKWEHKNDAQSQARYLDFYNRVMVPLVGSTYVHSATNIGTGRKEIQQLDEQVLPFRPEHRKHKHLQFGMATLFVDYAFLSSPWNSSHLTGETYAVEIKPKQGWIPCVDRTLNKCQFCLNQHLKLKKWQIKELSSYCPLDLFSGQKERMLKALKSLTYNPQNNLRVFKDGIYCYGENTSVQVLYDLLRNCFQQPENNFNNLIDDFCDLLIQALLKDFHKNQGCANCDDNELPRADGYASEFKQGGCVFEGAKLPRGCVLQRILSLQKLNRLGLNKYYSIYNALTSNKINCDDWTYVENLLQETTGNKVMCPECTIQKRARRSDGLVESELDLVPYLIAAVANDCSFMVTFRKIHKFEDIPDGLVINAKNLKFLVNIGVFDLYPKPLSTIEKHVKRNLKVQNAYGCSAY